MDQEAQDQLERTLADAGKQRPRYGRKTLADVDDDRKARRESSS